MASATFEILVKEWWGKESVILKPECFLSILKDEIIKEMTEEKMLNSDDLVSRNLTSHIKVCDKNAGGRGGRGGRRGRNNNNADKKSSQRSEDVYCGFEGIKYKMEPRNIVIGRNTLEYNLTTPHSPGTLMHFTIIFKKNILETTSRGKISDVINRVWSREPIRSFLSPSSSSQTSLSQPLAPVEKKEEKKSASEEKKGMVIVTKEEPADAVDECIVCMDAKRDSIFLPCCHLITCQACAKKVSTCPMCNKIIVEKKRVFAN
jgi:hypothetical protein